MTPPSIELNLIALETHENLIVSGIDHFCLASKRVHPMQDYYCAKQLLHYRHQCFLLNIEYRLFE